MTERPSTRRGQVFKTKGEALAWERDFLANEGAVHEHDLRAVRRGLRGRRSSPRLRETTSRHQGEHLIDDKLIPFFGEMRVVDITSKVDHGLAEQPAEGKGRERGRSSRRPTSERVENQLSAILNHAVRHYGLPANPLQKAGRVGEKQGKEYEGSGRRTSTLRFSEKVIDRPEECRCLT